MADKGYVNTLFVGLPLDLQAKLGTAFAYVLDNWRLGRCRAGTRATNAQLYGLTATTPSTPGQEFSIVHGLAKAPYLVIPFLDPGTVGSQSVPLTVTRAADTTRIYLSSSVANAPISVLVEAP